MERPPAGAPFPHRSVKAQSFTNGHLPSPRGLSAWSPGTIDFLEFLREAVVMPKPATRARTQRMSQAKMRLVSLLIPLVTLCGCAVVNSAPPPAEVRQLRDVRDACLARNVVALDDYRSDAASVGMAVVSACRYENAALVSAIAGPDGFRQSEIARQIDQNSRDAATQMVLSHRAAQRS